ncbi:uncharacterized protein METZ01_LOCUS126568 [marine metagenome]|jgi:hypothetical protein|uniref:Uncharacterized protein n=1 Tax=marine metagenome TaxID=408172 RepID=A0A381Y9P0_9ZZZZ
MSRIRLNQEYRNKVAVKMKTYAEQENTQEKEKFFQERENFKAHQDKTWELAKICVERQYPKEDVQMAHYLQDKYPNVNTIAKDSCFHFGYMGKPEEANEEDKYISKHFDFRLNGDLDNIDRQDDYGDKPYRPQSRDFGYAYFRDELKAQDKCNPDITIEMEGKDTNPHWTKYQDANDKYLGSNCGNGNLTSYSDKWDKEYELDLIGREYCRDRQIAVSREEYKTFEMWQQKKGHLIMAHYKWVKSILTQFNFIKDVLKGYKYLDEAIEFASESGLTITDAEIIRCNSSGLTIYNPKNAAAHLKAMKNKNVSREQKIAFRKQYEREQSEVVN